MFGILFSLLALSGCDSSGPGGGNNPPSSADSVTVAAEAINESGERIDTAAITFDGTQVGTGFAERTYEENPDQIVDIEADAEGLIAADSSVGLGSDHSLELTLREELPDEATISFFNITTDADSSVAGTWTWNDEQIASDVSSGSHTVSGSNAAGTLCYAENEYFLQECREVIPNQETVPVELEVQRKQVTVSVTPVDSTGTVRPETVTKVYEPYRSDSSKIEGEGSVELPARSDERELFSDLITEEPDSDKLDRYRSDTIAVLGAKSVDKQIAVDRLVPACNDLLDNDRDGKTDKEDTGCTDADGNYEPGDNNEVLNGTIVVVGRYYDNPTYVSSAEEERVAEIRPATNPLPTSITVAKGAVGFGIKVKVTEDTTGEDFAIHLRTGESNNKLTVESTSEVVVDQDTSDGWVFKPVYGFDRSTFVDGSHYAAYIWHGTEARGGGFGDGNDRVHVYLGKKPSRPYRISWAYEPEEVPNNQKSESLHNQTVKEITTLINGECRKVNATDKICKNPDWAGKLVRDK